MRWANFRYNDGFPFAEDSVSATLQTVRYGLVAFWNMDEATIAADYPSTVGSFTLSHNATELTANVDGRIGKCVQKTDGNYGYLYHAGTDLVNLDTFTYMAWCRYPSFTSAYATYRNPTIVGGQDYSVWRSRVVWSMPQVGHPNPAYAAGDIVNLWLYYLDAVGGQPNFSIVLEVPAATHINWMQNWHMITCRYDGNTITGDLYVVDGHHQVGNVIGALPTLASSHYYTFWPPQNMGCAVQGDMMGVWNRALSDTELDWIWNSGNGKQVPFL